MAPSRTTRSISTPWCATRWNFCPARRPTSSWVVYRITSASTSSCGRPRIYKRPCTWRGPSSDGRRLQQHYCRRAQDVYPDTFHYHCLLRHALHRRPRRLQLPRRPTRRRPPLRCRGRSVVSRQLRWWNAAAKAFATTATSPTSAGTSVPAPLLPGGGRLPG